MDLDNKKLEGIRVSVEKLSIKNKIDSVLNKFSYQREALIHNVNRTLLHNESSEIFNISNQKQFEDNCAKFKLTSREKEIAKLIAKGQVYKEIANTLNISDRTVATHIQNMFGKVNANNKVELMNRLGFSLRVN